MDISNETIIVELTGTPDKIDAFKNLVSSYGIIQIARTGVSALPRGGIIYEALKIEKLEFLILH